MVFAQTSSSDIVTTRLTLDEYRAMEQTSPERYEYRNGEIITMSGGSEAHSAIASNLLIYLGFLLRDTDFRLYNGDLRVWIEEYQCGTYTDLMVVQGSPEFNGERNDEIVNPLLVVEVLSPSTEAYDRGDKFRKYRSLESFCEYLLVSQTEPYIEQYYNQERNSNDRWLLQVHSGLERSIFLHSLNVEIPLTEIYRRINFWEWLFESVNVSPGAIILTRREHGETLAAIAQDLGMKTETVKTYVKLARKALKGTDEGASNRSQ